MKTNTPTTMLMMLMPAQEFPLTSFGVDYHNKLLTLYTSCLLTITVISISVYVYVVSCACSSHTSRCSPMSR